MYRSVERGRREESFLHIKNGEESLSFHFHPSHFLFFFLFANFLIFDIGF